MDETIKQQQQNTRNYDFSRSRKDNSGNHGGVLRSGEGGSLYLTHKKDHLLPTRRSDHHQIMSIANSNENKCDGVYQKEKQDCGNRLNYAKTIPVVITDDDDNDGNGYYGSGTDDNFEGIQMTNDDDDSNSSANDDYYCEGSSDDDDDDDDDPRQVHPPKLRRSLFTGQQQVKRTCANTTNNTFSPRSQFVETSYNKHYRHMVSPKANNGVPSMPNNAPVGGTNISSKNSRRKEEALAYLVRYETMVRQQEAEDMAVVAHIVPCLLRLEQLIHNSQNKTSTLEAKSNGDTSNETNGPPLFLVDSPLEMPPSAVPSDWMDRIFLYSDLVCGLELLQIDTKDGKGQQKQKSSEIEFMTTDRQLMMILRMIASSVAFAANDDDDDSDTEHHGDDRLDFSQVRRRPNKQEGMSISWLEIVQCYKVCITGMVALEHVPTLIARSSESVATPTGNNDDVRTRTRNRTLAMLSLFQSVSPLSRFHQIQQQHPRYHRFNNLKPKVLVDSSDGTTWKEEKQRNVCKNGKKESIRSNNCPFSISSLFGSLIVFITAVLLVGIVIDRLHVLNSSSFISQRSEVLLGFEKERMPQMMNVPPSSHQYRAHNIDNISTTSYQHIDQEGMINETLKETSLSNTPNLSLRDESANIEEIHLSEKSVASTDSLRHNPLIVATRAHYRPFSDSVTSIAIASAAVATTTIVPFIVGQILPVITVPVALVAATALPFVLATNHNAREWLFTLFRHFKGQLQNVLDST
jgi:hypothetical protein